MTGEAVLSAFLKFVVDKATTAAMEEYILFRDAHKHLQKLSSTLSTIQAVIEDAEERQINDKAVRDWLRNLKDVAYDIDDLLDRVATEAFQLRRGASVEKTSRKKQVSKYIFTCSSPMISRNKIARRIKVIRERLDEIAKERDNLRLHELSGKRTVMITERRETGFLVDQSCVIGRNKDRDHIIELLMSNNEVSGSGVSVAPIVGMGGLGKTTLAQLVYNDDRVKEHFKLMRWLCVSENFDAKRLIKEIIISIENRPLALTSLGDLQAKLVKIIKEERFLLVLDDIWSDNHDEWEKVRLPLSSGMKGSKILITTRIKKVADIMGTMEPVFLKGLSDDDCWFCFKRSAFGEENSSKHPKLEAIGRKIAEKLKGSPLAAKTIGGLLKSKFDENEWRKILENEIWQLPQEENDILPALRLSYQHLPANLKQCFAYCSIFPKDYEFDKSKLVQVWMAQGFIQPQVSKRMEDIGREYFDDLLSRSFFQNSKSRYVMHDLIHDLAQFISAEECFKLEGSGEIPERVRHLSLSTYNLNPDALTKLYKYKHLRTLVFYPRIESSLSHISSELFSQLKFIRVLDLSSNFIQELPGSIGNLKFLRYLDLSHSHIRRLPRRLSELYNLQTLNLELCSFLSELPKGISKLVNLRHIKADSTLISKISGIGRLSSLQDLKRFSVQDEIGYKIGELKNMVEIRGELHIAQLENVLSKEEASEA